MAFKKTLLIEMLTLSTLFSSGLISAAQKFSWTVENIILRIRIKFKNKKLRWEKIKKEAVKLLGKCERCGYNNCMAAFDFHHERGIKEENVQFFIENGSRQKTLKEIKKCILLCANCHREIHFLGQ